MTKPTSPELPQPISPVPFTLLEGPVVWDADLALARFEAESVAALTPPASIDIAPASAPAPIQEQRYGSTLLLVRPSANRQVQVLEPFVLSTRTGTATETAAPKTLTAVPPRNPAKVAAVAISQRFGGATVLPPERPVGSMQPAAPAFAERSSRHEAPISGAAVSKRKPGLRTVTDETHGFYAVVEGRGKGRAKNWAAESAERALTSYIKEFAKPVMDKIEAHDVISGAYKHARASVDALRKDYKYKGIRASYSAALLFEDLEGNTRAAYLRYGTASVLQQKERGKDIKLETGATDFWDKEPNTGKPKNPEAHFLSIKTSEPLSEDARILIATESATYGLAEAGDEKVDQAFNVKSADAAANNLLLLAESADRDINKKKNTVNAAKQGRAMIVIEVDKAINYAKLSLRERVSKKLSEAMVKAIVVRNAASDLVASALERASTLKKEAQEGKKSRVYYAAGIAGGLAVLGLVMAVADSHGSSLSHHAANHAPRGDKLSLAKDTHLSVVKAPKTVSPTTIQHQAAAARKVSSPATTITKRHTTPSSVPKTTATTAKHHLIDPTKVKKAPKPATASADVQHTQAPATSANTTPNTVANTPTTAPQPVSLTSTEVYPWNWAADKFGSNNATPRLLQAVSNAQAHGVNALALHSPSGQLYISVNGQTNTQYVVDQLSTFMS
jgi:hypothetical protein